jgi:hypothetical protein
VLLFYFRDDFQYVRSHDETQMVRMGGSVLFVHQFCQFSAVGRHQTGKNVGTSNIMKIEEEETIQ